jgi:hypothetical protein
MEHGFFDGTRIFFASGYGILMGHGFLDGTRITQIGHGSFLPPALGFFLNTDFMD